METFPQVVEESTLTVVVVQKHKVLDAHPVPGRQRALHLLQDAIAAVLQALWSVTASMSVSQSPAQRGDEK